jgi:hypothetical protein
VVGPSAREPPEQMRTYLCETLPPGVEVDPDDPCKRWLSRWGLSLGDLTRELLADVSRLMGTGDEGQALANATVRRYRRVAHSCIRRAIKLGLILGTSPLTALLLTSMIEWFTQLHYVEHVRERTELDELFRDILRFHWIDESRHAHQRRSYRWTFLVSGLEHPNFVGIVEQLTANGADKLSQAAGVLSA